MESRNRRSMESKPHVLQHQRVGPDTTHDFADAPWNASIDELARAVRRRLVKDEPAFMRRLTSSWSAHVYVEAVAEVRRQFVYPYAPAVVRG